MTTQEHEILTRRHNKEAEMFERAVETAKALAKGEIPEEALEAYVSAHFDNVNRLNIEDIQHEAQVEWTNWMGAYGQNAVDLLRLEKERPGYQRVRMLFGLYANGIPTDMVREIPQIVELATRQYEEAIEILDAVGIDRQDIKTEFAAVMAGTQDQPWKRVKTLEGAKAFELNYKGRISDVYTDFIRCIRRMNEAEMAKAWLLHTAQQAQCDKQPFNMAKSLRTLMTEGRKSYEALKRLPLYFDMNSRTLGEYADILSRNEDSTPTGGNHGTGRPLRLM